MRNISKIITIALILMLIGMVFCPNPSYSLRVPRDPNFPGKFNAIGHILIGENEDRVEVSDVEIALLGDMIDNPAVVSALSKVRGSIKNPAYLRSAVTIYLHDPKLFKRLISENIKENIIEDIGWGLSLHPEATKRALNDGFPFNGRWVKRITRGYFGTGGIVSAYDCLTDSMIEEIKKMGLLDIAAKEIGFVLSFKELPKETKTLVEMFHISPYRRKIVLLARVLKKYPEIGKQIFNNRYLKKLDNNTIEAVAMLMHKHGTSADEIKNILIDLDHDKWFKFIMYMSPNKIFAHLEAFYLDREAAMHFHHKYPHDAWWLDAFLFQSAKKSTYEKMLKAGFSELHINDVAADAYNANPDLFGWLFESSLTADVLDCLIMGDDMRITLFKNPVEYYIVMDWLRNLGLIAFRIDISTAEKISELCKEIAVFLRDDIEEAEQSLQWALSYYSKGMVPLDEVSRLCEIRFREKKGAELALEAGVTVEDISLEIARAFASGPDTEMAKTALYLSSQKIFPNEERLQLEKQFPISFDMIKEANLPLTYYKNWLELLDRKPSIIKLWKRIYSFNTKTTHELNVGLASSPLIVDISDMMHNPNDFIISLQFPEEDFKQDWLKKARKKHADGLAVAYTKIHIEGDIVFVGELQSDLDWRKFTSEEQERYKDRLEIAMLTLERIFEGMQIVVFPPSILLKRRRSALNTETAYRIYADIPNKLAYRITRLQKSPIKTHFALGDYSIDEHWFWIKDIPKNTHINDAVLASNIAGKKILIIQDSNNFYNAQKWRCEQEGGNVTRAKNYQEAIGALLKGKFDLVILDMGFPGENYDSIHWAGIDVLEFMITKNIIVPVLVHSSRVNKFKDIIDNIDNANHPNLLRIKDKLEEFVGVCKYEDPFTERIESFLQRTKSTLKQVISAEKIRTDS